MVFLYLLEEIAIVLLALLLVFQVLIPLMRGTPVFPLFRREHKLHRRLEEVKEDVREARVEREISRHEQSARDTRSSIPKDKKNQQAS